MQLEKQAGTLHDREFFHDMAMAWLGRIDESRRVQRLPNLDGRQGLLSTVTMTEDAVMVAMALSLLLAPVG